MSREEEILIDILGSKSKIKILTLLCHNPGREYSLSEIVERTNLNFKTVSTNIRVFKSYGIVIERRYGPAKLISINPQNPIVMKLIELMKVGKWRIHRSETICWS